MLTSDIRDFQIYRLILQHDQILECIAAAGSILMIIILFMLYFFYKRKNIRGVIAVLFTLAIILTGSSLYFAHSAKLNAGRMTFYRSMAIIHSNRNLLHNLFKKGSSVKSMHQETEARRNLYINKKTAQENYKYLGK